MDLRALAMGLAFAFIWASAFTSARMIVADAPPLTALALRFLISGLLGVGIAAALGQSWRLTREQWRATAIFGLSQNGLYLGLNFVAMQTLEASMASIIASTMPLLVALFGWIVLGERVRPLGVLGLVVGFAGVSIIMGSRITAGVDLYGLVLCIAGVFALTAATLAVRTASSGGNVLMIVGLQMLVGAAALGVAALAVGERWEVTWSWTLIAAFAYTTVFPGLVATLIWFLLVRRIGAVRAATFHFLSPFFGVSIAALLLGERLGPLDVTGVAVVMAGILAVQLSKQARATAPVGD
ncbi:DMT family transporter [Rhodovulum euryhalinum]|uniref:Threonine/homoserine efflux transporter RhtA n=1 Tax=Rhodovulum euryhalinum TaxID=35805 RepID=A0A4R2KHD8_9RHOB|nr:DMT family transporter [Rhodovulum euryhalinum]TCO69899.1 threonine/homoserine efflux transporter RhtA [Rhodovulum euryhalinum]